MPTDVEIFHKETAWIGGRLARETYPESVRDGYDYLEERARDLIRVATEATTGLPHIHFDFVLNGDINALAFTSQRRYFIGVNTGLIFMMQMVAGRMLSDARAFPQLADSAQERNDLPPLENYRPDADKMYRIAPIFVPRCPVRKLVFRTVVDQAVLFFVGHEIAHISRGHVDYLRVARRLRHTSEIDRDPGRVGEQLIERQCLEMDADRASIISRIGSLYLTLKDPTEAFFLQSLPPEYSIYIWAISLQIIFRLFGDIRFSRATLQEANYPPLAVRLLHAEASAHWHAVQRWGEPLKLKAMHALTAARRDTEAALAIITGEDAPVGALTAAVDPKMDGNMGEVGDHLKRLEDHWNTKLREKLQEHTFEPHGY